MWGYIFQFYSFLIKLLEAQKAYRAVLVVFFENCWTMMVENAERVADERKKRSLLKRLFAELYFGKFILGDVYCVYVYMTFIAYMYI